MYYPAIMQHKNYALENEINLKTNVNNKEEK